MNALGYKYAGDVRKSWGHWLSQFHWQLYGTLTFKLPVSQQLASSVVHKWLDALPDGRYAWVGHERGDAGDRAHCHVLVGGLYVGSGIQSDQPSPIASVVCRARSLWRWGNAELVPYDPRRGAAWYVTKCPDEGEIIGVLRRHKKHAGGGQRT